MTKEIDLRGDKLKDLIFFVYLHNRYSKDKIKVADLKKIFGYSSGGVIYHHLDSSVLHKGK